MPLPRNAQPISSINAAKKDLAEKVKVLKNRQKNWMQQREMYLKTTSSEPENAAQIEGGHLLGTVPGLTDLGPSKTDELSTCSDVSQLQTKASPGYDKNGVMLNHGFSNWLQARSHPHKLGSGETSGQQPPCKRLQQACSKESLGHEKYMSGTHCDQGQGEKKTTVSVSSTVYIRGASLSSDQSDTLTDKTGQCMKQTVPGSAENRNKQSLPRSSNKVCNEVTRGRTFTQEVSVPVEFKEAEGGPVDMSSHRCQFCTNLMLQNKHVPTLMVPCGHTVCKACAESHRLCRLCGAEVSAVTTNIMLQQIIQEYQQKVVMASPSARGRQQEDALNVSATPPLFAESGYTSVNYAVQLQTLLKQAEAVKEEVASTRQTQEQMVAQLKKTERRLEAIRREELVLDKKRMELEEQLEGLRQHRHEYEGEYRQLLHQKEAASEHLVMTEKTLLALGQEIDKVTFLAEGEGQMKKNGLIHIMR